MPSYDALLADVADLLQRRKPATTTVVFMSVGAVGSALVAELSCRYPCVASLLNRLRAVRTSCGCHALGSGCAFRVGRHVAFLDLGGFLDSIDSKNQTTRS